MKDIIDAHHHLWNYNPEEYGWIDDTMELLRRDYLLEELRDESRGAGVSGTVVVQARQSVQETMWLLSLAESDPMIRGVVGWLDLRAEGLEAQIEGFAIHPKLVGLRHVLQDESDGEFMLSPSFIQGIARLTTHHLTYDILIYHHQLKQAARLVEMFPGQKFVLDHMAKPPVWSEKLHPWKEQLEQLARFPNVWCKISGLVTEADHLHWSYESLVPYLEVVSRAFGKDRIMVGSDWPVCRLAAEYAEVMSIPVRYFAEWSREEQWKIFHQNALECYDLEV
jgi:L-fuconolactonase